MKIVLTTCVFHFVDEAHVRLLADLDKVYVVLGFGRINVCVCVCATTLQQGLLSVQNRGVGVRWCWFV